MFSFKLATTQDIREITNLVNSAFRGESSKVGWTTEADLLGGQRTDDDKISEMILAFESRIELVLKNNELIGCIHIKKESDAIYFGMLTVKPNLQNLGTGKLLLRRLEELTRNWGFQKIRMTVISQRKELIDFYERRGYRWTGRIEPFPEHDPRFGIPKTNLIFHVFEKDLSELQK